MTPYNPEHIALQHPLISELEPYLSLQQSEVLVKSWESGWRPVPPYPQMIMGGEMIYLARRRVGDDVWQLKMRVLRGGLIVDREEIRE